MAPTSLGHPGHPVRVEEIDVREEQPSYSAPPTIDFQPSTTDG